MKKFTRIASLITTIIALVLILVFAVIALTGCNQQIIDTTWSFNKAIIYRQDGTTIEGVVESWKDFENSDMVQVKIDNVTYLTHSSNVVLIHE